MQLPPDKRSLLESIVNDLKRIDGVKALVLGGSYAAGTATESSDLDIGIYYFNESPFDIEEIKRIALNYSRDDRPTVTGFYEWGPWVNGGAWINTKAGEVDFLYKNIEQIGKTIQNSKSGIWENHFEQQPPYGFSSIFFLAETKIGLPLFDPEGIVERLKSEVQTYPLKLKQSVIQQSLWSAEFSTWQAGNFAAKQDIYNTAGCLTRAIKSIVTALFAINEIYPMGDKRAIEILEASRTKPPRLKDRIEQILCIDKPTLNNNISNLKELFDETVKLALGAYKPYYEL